MQEVKLTFDRTAGDYRMKEAFKTLRTNIEFCGGDVRVIAVTSCTPNEGKSSVAMEMAKAFAEAGNKTMLIDADMRKSILVGRYKTGAVRLGLTHCLAGKANYLDVACETNLKNLYITFSGPVPPNPSELLGGEKFGAILEMLRKSYDYVIIDTPPLGSVIDAAVVAKRCDGTVMVIENNAVSYKFVQRVKDQLDKTGCRILGVVLNKVDMDGKGYYGQYGKYYGKYYGRYGESDSVEHAARSVNTARSQRTGQSRAAGTGQPGAENAEKLGEDAAQAGAGKMLSRAGAGTTAEDDVQTNAMEKTSPLSDAENAEKESGLFRAGKATQLNKTEPSVGKDAEDSKNEIENNKQSDNTEKISNIDKNTENSENSSIKEEAKMAKGLLRFGKKAGENEAGQEPKEEEDDMIGEIEFIDDI